MYNNMVLCDMYVVIWYYATGIHVVIWYYATPNINSQITMGDMTKVII